MYVCVHVCSTCVSITYVDGEFTKNNHMCGGSVKSHQSFIPPKYFSKALIRVTCIKSRFDISTV